jgi:hypothetical protein
MKERPGVCSHRIGLVTLSDGRSVAAYRAVVRLTCTDCMRPILPGDLFSRRTQPVSRLSASQGRVDVCAVCRPLHLEGHMVAASLAEEEQGR